MQVTAFTPFLVAPGTEKKWSVDTRCAYPL
jgi:hypothetical protein